MQFELMTNSSVIPALQTQPLMIDSKDKDSLIFEKGDIN